MKKAAPREVYERAQAKIMERRLEAIEGEAFAAFAELHPHEAHRLRPEEFWRVFHARFPNITREQMERLLQATEETDAKPQNGVDPV